jgi:plasmid stabilization system protein ParE
MAQVNWTPGSLADIEIIAAYIATDSRFQATRQVERILSAEDLISQFPGGGRRVPEMKIARIREVILPPYRIIYHVSPDKAIATVLTVIHSRQRMSVPRVRRRLTKR